VKSLSAAISSLRRNRLLWDSWRVLATTLFAALVVASVSAAFLRSQGEGWRQAISATAPWQALDLRGGADNDSWGPMLDAWLSKHHGSAESMYRRFHEDGVKFQYPPASLLLLEILPPALTLDPQANAPGSPLRASLQWLSRGAFALTLLFAALALCAAIAEAIDRPLTLRETVVCGALVAMLGLAYYPLTRAYQLGQVQIFLDCLVSLATMLLVCRRPAPAGICIALCCLIKPQYALLLFWGVLQKNWRFCIAMLVTAIALVTVSIALFGFADHWAYLDVLRQIARHGEAFWMNQSVNGLLHRLLDNGSATQFHATAFAPYHPVVYAGTLLSTVLILGSAFWFTGRAGATHRLATFGIVLIGATIGSPIAWEHHYGVIFPVLVVTLPTLLARRPFGAFTPTAWILSFLAMGCVLLRPMLFVDSAWLTIAATHILFGGLLLFIALCVCVNGPPAADQQFASHGLRTAGGA
jgi:alpha-1,2-mannosyltransferase